MKSIYFYQKHSLTPVIVNELEGFIKEDKKTIAFNRPLDYWETHINNLSIILFYKAE